MGSVLDDRMLLEKKYQSIGTRRKSRSGSETSKRTRLIQVRLTPHEYELLQRAAAQTQDRISDYIRHFLILRGESASRRSTPGEVRMAALYLAQLGKIGSNLNQIARAVNMGQAGHQAIEDALAEGQAFKELLVEIIRRRAR